jgi:beta-galactosidase/beta-glucuronidase
VANAEARLEIPVPAPKKWDAERPNLYTLEATLNDDVPLRFAF